MIIPNNYYINVSTPPTFNAKYGVHYCRIELGDITEKEAKEKYDFIQRLFPLQYNLKLYYVNCYGTEVKA